MLKKLNPKIDWIFCSSSLSLTIWNNIVRNDVRLVGYEYTLYAIDDFIELLSDTSAMHIYMYLH